MGSILIIIISTNAPRHPFPPPLQDLHLDVSGSITQFDHVDDEYCRADGFSRPLPLDAP